MQYDVAIIGGGPAGLNAALILGRVPSRKVLLVDSNQSRNGPSHAMHGFLSRDGLPPGELRRIGREQLVPYENVTVLNAAVQSGQAIPGGFRLQMSSGVVVEAKKVIVATGVVDPLPSITGLDQFYGRSVFLCPYCDAWEFRNQTIGVLGAGGVDTAIMLRSWSPTVLFFSDGHVLPQADLQRLTRAGVRVVGGKVESLDGTFAGLLTAVVVSSRGEAGLPASRNRIPCQALFLSLPGRSQRSNIAQQLGVPPRTDGGLEHGDQGKTRVRGVYVIGDASKDVTFAIVAAAEGAVAAAAVDHELRMEGVV